MKYIDLVILTVCRSPLSQCQNWTVYYTWLPGSFPDIRSFYQSV